MWVGVFDIYLFLYFCIYANESEYVSYVNRKHKSEQNWVIKLDFIQVYSYIYYSIAEWENASGNTVGS